MQVSYRELDERSDRIAAGLHAVGIARGDRAALMVKPSPELFALTFADLGISKTDGVTSAVPGESLTYTITATNNGPDDAATALVNDTFPVPPTVR